jgi:osmotically inducible protein OsmC
MPIRNADAVWEGDLQGGNGHMRFGSGAFDGQYSFTSRFEEGTGTNPEELAAAAHAGCFSMALSGALGREGHPPTRVHTTAKVHLDKAEVGFQITHIELETEAEVPGIDDADFQRIAEGAKQNCPISKLYAGAEITLVAKLTG